MKKNLSSILMVLGLLGSAFFPAPNQILAQEGPFFYSDANWESRPFYPPGPSMRNAGIPDTLTIGPGNPFFDDFSYPGILPDSNLWFIPDPAFVFNTPPTLNRGKAISPPTAGVATFNGARSNGRPYVTSSFSSGKADQLISHFIDLSTYGPADNLRLSFVLQPQGRGEAPEPNDTFSVFFITPQDTIRSFSTTGGGSTAFRQYSLPIDQPGLFDPEFQIVFESWGSLNGDLDVWHLDYVFLGLNRSPGDTLFNDRSVVQLERPLFDPYSALPARLYQQGFGSMQPFQVENRNLSNNNTQVTVASRIVDQTGNNSFSGSTSQSLAVTLPAQGVGAAPFNPFDNQSLSTTADALLTINLDQPADDFSQNDTLRYSFGMDSLLAIDDGEADLVFGMNAPRGFGTLVETGQPDSLTAVWIRFVPLLNIRQNLPEYMEGKAFRIVLWKDPHPDSVIIRISGGQNIRYADTPNTYLRYPFTEPIAVPGKFWIGIQQFDALSVGVGFDRTYANPNLTFYDSAGTWISTGLAGSLMIRPEFFSGLSQPLSIEKTLGNGLKMEVFPNPSEGQFLRYRVSGAQPLRELHFEVRDLQGKIFCSSFDIEPVEGRLNLPGELAPGIYLIRFWGSDQQGRPHHGTQRLSIIR